MEITRERGEVTRDERTSIEGRIPSAPDLDQESLGNVIEEDNWMPDRVERARPLSTWTKIRRSLSRYRTIKEPVESLANQDDRQIDETRQPIANNAPSSQDPVFGDLDTRNAFLRKLYMMLVGQLTCLTGLCALFYYSPHIRHIFRKTFADKIFLGSMLGFPLGVALVVMALFQSIRREYSSLSVILLTACLSSVLCYLMAFQSDNLFLLMEMMMLDGTFALVGVANLLVPRFSLRHRLEASFFPVSMGFLQFLQPLFVKQRHASTWPKNLVFVGVTTYLAYNLSSILNDQKLNLKPNEVWFGVTQTFLNFNPAKSIGDLFKQRREVSGFQRI